MEEPNDFLGCPFCGGTNIHITSPSSVQPRHFVALCTNDVDKPGCGASSQWHRVPAEARDAWNRRAGAHGLTNNGRSAISWSAWLDALSENIASAKEIRSDAWNAGQDNLGGRVSELAFSLADLRRQMESASNG